MTQVRNILSQAQLAISLIICLLAFSCTSKTENAQIQQEDKAAKQKLQGTWINEMDGDVFFSIKGDTLFYNDSLSAPVSFYVNNDSLIICNHQIVRYPIVRLNSTQFYFINADGDEVNLVKSDNAPALQKGEYKGTVDLNQKQKIKNDSVVTCNGKRLHAYTQVNPTSYKVYHQTTNDDGMTVENVYYDNIVFVALYDGNRKVFGQNFQKKDFASLVPKTYIDGAVLSEIIIQGATNDGVRFVAILSKPDSYTNYRINIDITADGKKKLSV